MSTSQYQPGVCNIGGPEVKRRKQVFQFGSLLFIAISLYLIITGANSSAAAITFFPAILAAVGFIQSRKKFCFAFGLMGTFNFAEAGKMSKVLSKDEISADRKQALTIIAQSMAVAFIATVLVAALLAL